MKKEYKYALKIQKDIKISAIFAKRSAEIVLSLSWLGLVLKNT